MDPQRFEQICAQILASPQRQDGIGTLGEKTMHAVLKHYFEPHTQNHEIKIGGYVADIVGEDGIIEIQTRQFDRLRKKLTAFLQVCDVTIVHPIPHVKWLSWIDPDTGAVTKKRKSPKVGTPCDIFRELYKIKPLLHDPHLHLCIVLVDVEEYRYLNGWSADRKKGSSRCDRVPVGIVEELYLYSIEDYRKLLPAALPTPFTSKDLSKAAKISISCAQTALNILFSLGIVERVGKKKNAYLYQLT